MYQIETKKLVTADYRLAIVCLSVAGLFALTATVATAADTTGADTTVPEDIYVDSVYSWGSWELGLEPASGPTLHENNAMNDRSRQLQFRPNDNAAYTTQSVAIPPVSIITPLPPKPALPPKPIPPPGFTGGAPTTADPRN